MLTGLKSCTHVHIRIDATRESLQPFYKGPYFIVKRSEKYFTLLINNKFDNVSIDRLKPAKFIPIDYDIVFSQLLESHQSQREEILSSDHGNIENSNLTEVNDLELDELPNSSTQELPKENPTGKLHIGIEINQLLSSLNIGIKIMNSKIIIEK